MTTSTFAAMQAAIVNGAPDQASELARQAVAEGIDPLEAINLGFVPGMTEVGEQFAQRKMYLPDMLAAAEAMKAAMSVLDPELKRQGGEQPCAGTVVLGTAKGDIHEIGKVLVGTLLTAHGFKVYDLGVDVSSEKFAAKACEVKADVVGVSALLTTTMQGQKSVIEKFDREGLRPGIRVIIGGAPVSRRWAEEIGADGFTKDAVAAVELVHSLVKPA
jgi:corrinoid protein of di/trimethylamine methyltransferase